MWDCHSFFQVFTIILCSQFCSSYHFVVVTIFISRPVVRPLFPFLLGRDDRGFLVLSSTDEKGLKETWNYVSIYGMQIWNNRELEMLILFDNYLCNVFHYM